MSDAGADRPRARRAVSSPLRAAAAPTACPRRSPASRAAPRGTCRAGAPRSVRYAGRSRRLILPRVLEEVREELALDCRKMHADRGQPLAPEHLLAHIGRALDGGENAALVEHHVHPFFAPERGEDLAADAERRTPVVVLLDRLGQG